MSATVVREAVLMAATAESQAATAEMVEVESAKCDSCSLTEECTQGYINRIRERFQGKWICGLCAEAVKDEIVRSERLISTEEALNRHMSFRKRFSSESPPPDPTFHLISAMRQLLRRSLDSSSPRSLRSMPSSPTKRGEGMMMIDQSSVLARSGSCMPALTLDDVDGDDLSSVFRSREEGDECEQEN